MHISEILALQTLGVAHGLVDQAVSEGVEAAHIAQVELQTQDVDSGDGILPPVFLADSRSQGCRCLGGLFGVGSQRADRLEGLGLGASGGDEDEVGCQGARSEEFVDEALADAEANATVEDLSVCRCLRGSFAIEPATWVCTCWPL